MVNVGSRHCTTVHPSVSRNFATEQYYSEDKYVKRVTIFVYILESGQNSTVGLSLGPPEADVLV